MKKFLIAGILGLAVLDSPVYAQGYIQLYNNNAANLITYGDTYTGHSVGEPVAGYNVGMFYFVGDIAATVNAAFSPEDRFGYWTMVDNGMVVATGNGATAVLGANGFPAGLYGSSETFVVPGASAGSVVTVVVVAYNTFAYVASPFGGHSQAFTMIAGTSTSAPSTGDYMNAFQVGSFFIPEPTSFTLVGLGLGVLSLWRRLKVIAS